MALQCVLKIIQTAHGIQKIKEVPASSVSQEVRSNPWNSTVKTLGLLQPYLCSCMPVVYVLQTSKDASNLIQSVVEDLLADDL